MNSDTTKNLPAKAAPWPIIFAAAQVALAYLLIPFGAICYWCFSGGFTMDTIGF